MKRSRDVLVGAAVVGIVLVLTFALLARQAVVQQAQQQAQARDAILGRWRVLATGGASARFTLDLRPGGTGTCTFDPPGGGTAAVTYTILPVPLQRRLVDLLRKRPAEPDTYLIRSATGAALSPLGLEGPPWRGEISGMGNLLLLSPQRPAPPLALQRIGSSPATP